jgi:hypothetical protein
VAKRTVAITEKRMILAFKVKNALNEEALVNLLFDW